VVLSMDKQSYVYMMASASRRALYTGVTAKLRERIYEHKNNLIEGFSSKYKCHRLVYYETFSSITEAIAREKQIKGWRREKKVKLVVSLNPAWKDLAADWFPEELLLHGKPIEFGNTNERKVPRAYGRADESARPVNGPRDDE
jgi:putative endonuclease